jgi:hypothetical protein
MCCLFALMSPQTSPVTPMTQDIAASYKLDLRRIRCLLWRNDALGNSAAPVQWFRLR